MHLGTFLGLLRGVLIIKPIRSEVAPAELFRARVMWMTQLSTQRGFPWILRRLRRCDLKPGMPPHAGVGRPRTERTPSHAGLDGVY